MDAETIVWVRSGGRCAICNRYLLDDTYGSVVSIGENAHIVGRKNTPGSPRGDDPLPLSERDKPENLVLLCREQHRTIDNEGVSKHFTVDELRKIKARHEKWIHKVTEMKSSTESAVLRLSAHVRGSSTDLSRAIAANAVIESGRIPSYPLSFRDEVEIDLRALEDEGGATYYAAARNQIAAAVSRLREAIRTGDVGHVSVFAFARVPLLVCLGSMLDDTFALTIFQRRRQGESWSWASGTPSPPVEFEFVIPSVPADCDDLSLIMNISGTIATSEIPSTLTNFPACIIQPTSARPEPDTVAHESTLNEIAFVFRRFFAELEAKAKWVKRLHVFAALPISASVALGRSLNSHVAPKLLMYEVIDGERVFTMEVGR